jgi:protein SCO1/2
MRAASVLCVVLVAVLAACGADEVWRARGVVEAVMHDDYEVRIRHGEIEGLMDAMTMSFHAEGEVLERLEAGQEIEFNLRKRGRVYEVVDFEVVGEGNPGSLPPLVEVRDPAPGFELVDQAGAALSLSDLAGRAVLLDFIFTHCPGPCPILTGILADVQGGLDDAQRQRTHFVSITVDPARDTPEVLRAYAEARKLDLSNWSFLTGAAEAIDAVARGYGVGTVPQANGEIVHTVATFLIDPEGRIAERYVGTSHEPARLLRDLRRVL